VSPRRFVAALVLAVVAGTAQAATHLVTIEGMAFHPASVSVKPGDTVTWTNKDVVPHTVTAAGRFDSGQVDAGKRWSWTAKQSGRIGYVCTYHPGMQGTVEVR
jgi:plastocyanin